MNLKNSSLSPTAQLFSSVTAITNRMWIFIRAESFMTWQLMRLVSGRKLCLEDCLVPIGHREQAFWPGPSSQAIRVEWVMDGSKGYLLKSVSMREKNQAITHLFKHWWTITTHLWQLIRPMSPASTLNPTKH